MGRKTGQGGAPLYFSPARSTPHGGYPPHERPRSNKGYPTSTSVVSTSRTSSRPMISRTASSRSSWVAAVPVSSTTPSLRERTSRLVPSSRSSTSSLTSSFSSRSGSISSSPVLGSM